jgi:hypothetical protein
VLLKSEIETQRSGGSRCILLLRFETEHEHRVFARCGRQTAQFEAPRGIRGGGDFRISPAFRRNRGAGDRLIARADHAGLNIGIGRDREHQQNGTSRTQHEMNPRFVFGPRTTWPGASERF